MRTFVPAACLVLTALAGCSGGGGAGEAAVDDYPQDYMLARYGVPDGFELLSTDHEAWQFFGPEFGMEENPGYADPNALNESEDGEEVPLPEKLYVAFYVSEGFGEAESDTVLFSMAALMSSNVDADDVEDAADLCEPDEETGEDDDESTIALRDGRAFALVFSFGLMDLHEELSEVASEMRAATGAEIVCEF